RQRRQAAAPGARHLPRRSFALSTHRRPVGLEARRGGRRRQLHLGRGGKRPAHRVRAPDGADFGRQEVTGKETAMKRIPFLAIVMAIALPIASAEAWMRAGAWGGHAWGNGDGTWAARGARGGTASGSDGSWNATGWRGGTASGGG